MTFSKILVFFFFSLGKFKFGPFRFSGKKKKKRKEEKKGSYSPKLLHETVFGCKQTQTSHTRDWWPGALFVVYRQEEYPAEKDSQGLWNPAREQENLPYGTYFSAVSCSEELKICQNMLPFVSLLIEMCVLHSASYSDVSTNVAHEERASTKATAQQPRGTDWPPHTNSPQCPQKCILILVKSIPEKSVSHLV